MINIPQAIKTGISIYKVIEHFLTEICDEIGKIYIDLAEAHFLSAKQAYEAYKSSNKPEAEIRSMINHLRDSHNIYHTLVRRTEAHRVLLFLEYTDKPNCNNKTTLLITDISTIISLLYLQIGEIDNARYWKKLTIDDFDYYEANYKFDYDELAKISPEFAYLKNEPIPFNAFNRVKFISEKGKAYAMTCLQDHRKELLSILNF